MLAFIKHITFSDPFQSSNIQMGLELAPPNLVSLTDDAMLRGPKLCNTKTHLPRALAEDTFGSFWELRCLNRSVENTAWVSYDALAFSCILPVECMCVCIHLKARGLNVFYTSSLKFAETAL